MDSEVLNNSLQRRLRENVKFSFNDFSMKRQFHSTIFVGEKGLFLGEWAKSPEEARQSAMNEVLSSLENLTEHEFRHACGLPQRFHLNELDNVRDNLRALRQRVKVCAWGVNGASVAIGKLYEAVDCCEREVMRHTGEFNPQTAESGWGMHV